MLTLKIGGNFTVKRIGLGTNRISDTVTACKVLLKAQELGVNFIDTADIYMETASESMIAKTLAPYRNSVIATKGGMVQRTYHTINEPEHLRAAIDGSLRRLKLERIPLYQLHRIDPNIPLAQTMKILKEAQDAGKVEHIGLSEATVAQIEEARRYVNIVTVQNHYNLAARHHEAVLEHCEREGIAFLPFFPLARGRGMPTVESRLVQIAKKYDATPNQIALAWLLKRSPVMLPIPGTLSEAHLQENVDALTIDLTDADFVELSADSVS